MSSLTCPRPRVKPAREPRAFSCSFVSMTIEINDVRYSVDAIDAGEFGTKAYRLTKHTADRAVHDVLRTHAGPIECSCPDFVCRRQGLTDEPCKHGLALLTLGLLPALATATREDIPGVTRVRDEFDGPAADALPDRGQDLARLEVARHADVWDPAEVGPDGRPWEGEPAPAEADVFPPDRIDPDDAESDPELWDEGWDDHTWNLDPAPADATLDLAELVDRQAASYRAWSTEAGEMIARALDELALKIRMVDATTPAEYRARIEVLDAGIREQYEAIGFENGRASCQGEPAGAAWGHGA
jgi:hypothetical protein